MFKRIKNQDKLCIHNQGRRLMILRNTNFMSTFNIKLSKILNKYKNPLSKWFQCSCHIRYDNNVVSGNSLFMSTEKTVIMCHRFKILKITYFFYIVYLKKYV